MKDETKKNLVKVIRVFGIILGVIFTFVCLSIVFFSSEPLRGSSFLERANSFIPYLAFGVILLIPYRCIKKKLLIYFVSLIFILLFLGWVYIFYCSWYPGYPSSIAFSLSIANLIPLGAFLIFVLNIWAFFEITNRILLWRVLAYTTLFIVVIGGIWLSIVSPKIKVPNSKNYQQLYKPNISRRYEDEIFNIFGKEARLKNPDKSKFKIETEIIIPKTRTGPIIQLTLIIRYLDNTYFLAIEGQRNKLEQYSDWKISSIKRIK